MFSLGGYGSSYVLVSIDVFFLVLVSISFNVFFVFCCIVEYFEGIGWKWVVFNGRNRRRNF